MTTELKADYLVIGAGASGMAFVDVLLSETNASIIMVDKELNPGGHWNHAYPFVTLHQPSAFYGVSSTNLGSRALDKVGLNKGLNNLASGAEVSAYFQSVMHDRFLPSGRVQYFAKSEYQGDGVFISQLTGKSHKVKYRTLVDSTFFKTSIPATHNVSFPVSEVIRLIPPNGLSQLSQPAEGYTIIGGGKTGIDTCLWLLEQGVNPDNIRWIMPRDAWFLDRKNTQPTDAFFNDAIGAQALQMEAIANSDSMEDMFLKLEQAGVFLRLDSNVLPEMFHGATISQPELAQLQRVKNIVRLGRVTEICDSEIQLQQGSIPTSPGTIHIDCTASAITNLSTKDVFTENRITIQTVRAYQPTFSAAFIAHTEATYSDTEKKNQLCKPVPLPNSTEDWVLMTYKNMMNQYFWSREPGLKKWLHDNRLDGFTKLVSGVKFYQIEKLKILNRMRKAAKPAVAKLKKYKALIEAKQS